MKTLPTTPGSIVKFYSGLELPGEDFWYVVTLMPGHIDEDGVAHNLVWATSDESGEGDATSTEARILAEDLVRVISENEVPADAQKLVEDFKDSHVIAPGTVIRLTDPDAGVKLTYTYAPAYLDEDVLTDLDFVNSYGGYIAVSDAMYADDLEILYTPKA